MLWTGGQEGLQELSTAVGSYFSSKGTCFFLKRVDTLRVSARKGNLMLPSDSGDVWLSFCFLRSKYWSAAWNEERSPVFSRISSWSTAGQPLVNHCSTAGFVPVSVYTGFLQQTDFCCCICKTFKGSGLAERDETKAAWRSGTRRARCVVSDFLNKVSNLPRRFPDERRITTSV